MLGISKAAYEEMVADAQETYPDECCGFMFGNELPEQRTITLVTRVMNAKDGDKRRRFEISAKDYLQAEKFADENEQTLLGVYHSHPDHPSIPSEHDRVAAQPFFSYVIISIRENEFASIQSWRLNEEEQFKEEEII